MTVWSLSHKSVKYGNSFVYAMLAQHNCKPYLWNFIEGGYSNGSN